MPTRSTSNECQTDDPRRDLSWLASAIKRQVGQVAATHFRKSRARKWNSLCEQDIVACVQSVFVGLGYVTWLEDTYPDGGKVDLWAESVFKQDSDPDWLVEVKRLYDSKDNRLNIGRFDNVPEILKDFTKLSRMNGKGERIVVWVVFSREREHVRAPQGRKTYRLGDVVDEINRRHLAFLAAQQVFDADELADCEDWRFVHVLIWSLADAVPASTGPARGR